VRDDKRAGGSTLTVGTLTIILVFAELLALTIGLCIVIVQRDRLERKVSKQIHQLEEQRLEIDRLREGLIIAERISNDNFPGY
jgi:hypothetical protein